jgi:hypothetical protein
MKSHSDTLVERKLRVPRITLLTGSSFHYDKASRVEQVQAYRQVRKLVDGYPVTPGRDPCLNDKSGQQHNCNQLSA